MHSWTAVQEEVDCVVLARYRYRLYVVMPRLPALVVTVYLMTSVGQA
jgi:ABC-type transporter Mla maintaining outer membrane lipid asymmetry permease subunit MlaE